MAPERTARSTARASGAKRKTWPTWSTQRRSRARFASSKPSRAVGVIGFSTSTCLPLSRAARAISSCAFAEVTTSTHSASSRRARQSGEDGSSSAARREGSRSHTRRSTASLRQQRKWLCPKRPRPTWRTLIALLSVARRDPWTDQAEHLGGGTRRPDLDRGGNTRGPGRRQARNEEIPKPWLGPTAGLSRARPQGRAALRKALQ